jgi:hypothetical protein
MKQVMLAVLFCVCLALGNEARCTTLPDSCGDDKVQFDVKTEKHPPAPTSPEPGKAQIVVIGLVDAPGCLGCGIFSPRVGVDGSWVGATKGNSYFVLSVDRGVHHVCADWKSINAARRKNVGVASLTAEPGQVYFFQVKISEVLEGVAGMPNGPVTSKSEWVLSLTQLSEDEGRYQMKVSALATSTPKKH